METTDENEFGEAIHEAGSVELLDAYGNPVGTVTASPTDENGNPVREEEQTESADESLYGDAWDGIHMDFDIHTWYAKAKIYVKRVIPSFILRR